MKQATDLSESEAMVQRVYEQQLETILFTINQNSENIIYSWINRIDIPIEQQSGIMESIVSRLLQNNSAISQIAFFDIDTGVETAIFGSSDNREVTPPDRILTRKLVSFIEQNYQRIEGVNEGEYTLLYFVFRTGENSCIGAFRVHSETFIDENLGAGIQQISQDKFQISIVDTTAIQLSDQSDENLTREAAFQYSEMWYFPGYRAGIGLQTSTITELVKIRSQRDVYIFWFLVIVVFMGLVFAISTIRREMRLAELKSEFVSNVSHEIRTPLALISMYAETLLMKRIKSNEKADEYLNVIVNETARLGTIVNRILSFSKMEGNKREYHFEEVNINELVDVVVGNFQTQFESNKVKCYVNPGKISKIAADKDAVSEVIINLIDNALKYSNSDNSIIEVRTGEKGNTVYIEIEDNGIGIQAKHQKLIFDKFYRVTQGSLAHKAKGSGLGLNIVQQIMKQHKGEIKVKSEYGKGSVFTLIFKKN